MTLVRGFPRLIIKRTREWYDSLADLARSLDTRYDHIIENVQQLDTDLNITYTIAATEPTISAE